MTYTGIVKEGKIELPAGVKLPEGTTVRVEVGPEETWIEGWEELARQVTEAWQSPKSALEILDECRR
jgi:hypothetical protein